MSVDEETVSIVDASPRRHSDADELPSIAAILHSLPFTCAYSVADYLRYSVVITAGDQPAGCDVHCL